MNKALLFTLFLIGCSALAACGFKPMYGENAAAKVTSTELAQIKIANLPDRSGQMLRNELVDILQPSGASATPRFLLDIKNFREDIRDLDITVLSDTTREQMKISGKLVLTDINSGEIVLEKILSARGSYNILESEYTSRVSRQDLRRDLIEKIASQTQRYIALHFHK